MNDYGGAGRLFSKHPLDGSPPGFFVVQVTAAVGNAWVFTYNQWLCKKFQMVIGAAFE
jgi:hypothetical protein